MDLTQQRQMLYATAVGLVIAGGVAVVWALGDLPQRSSSNDPMSRPAKPTISAGVGQDVPTDDRDSSFLLSLQQPLYDPPPPPPKPKPKPVVPKPPTPAPVRAPRLDWTLVGTVIDSQRRVAILSDSAGNTDIRAAGEEVELTPKGVVVRNVDAEEVTLEHRGSKSKLRLEQDFQATGGEGNNRATRRRNR